MVNVKEYIKKESKNELTEKRIEELKDKVNKEFKVELPKDYCEFLKLSNGFLFQGCDEICGEEKIFLATHELKELLEDWETIDLSSLENFVVIGNIFEHGYIIYLNESKKYILNEDIFSDFSLDVKNEEIYKFSNIWEIFVYYDYYCGDKVFEKEYKNIFSKKISAQENSYNSYLKKQEEFINKLNNDVVVGNAIDIEIKINKQYLDVLKNEYQNEIAFLNMCSYSTIQYVEGQTFKVYINLINDKIEIVNNNKVASSVYPQLDYTISTIIDKNKYLVLITMESCIEPIIIFKETLNKDKISKIKDKYIKEDSSLVRRFLSKFFN